MMSSLAFLGTLSTLQAHSPPKTIAFSISRTDESNMTYNYANTIWIQDQAFMEWHKA